MIVELVLPYMGQIDKTKIVTRSIQIGDLIISPESHWEDGGGVPVYDLLLADGALVSPVTHPTLSKLRTHCDKIHNEQGSPFPYRYVADYTGGSHGAS